MAQQPTGTRSRPDWSTGLPELELLQSIGKRLASGQDAASFRSACVPWRATVPFESFAPLLLLPFDPVSERITFYSVSEEKVVSSLPLPADVVRGGKVVPCGASRGWLALMDEAASVTLLNPFTGARVELPPADERIAAASSSARVSKLDDGRWVLHPDADSYGGAAASRFVELDEMRDVFFREIVLSARPYAGGDPECVAVAVLATSTKVAFCCVGVDSAWTLLDTNLEGSVDCVIHCQDKFFAVDFSGDVSMICYAKDAGATPTATPVPSLSPPPGICNRSYLESNGELHLVGATVEMFHGIQRFTYTITVYRCRFLQADDPTQTPVWSRVHDAGDQTLLVSKHFNENFSGPSVSEYKMNSVYFSEALYGDRTDMEYRYEVVDIATHASEVVPFREKMEPLQALCWFRPDIWMRGGLSRYEYDAEKLVKRVVGPNKI